MKGLLVALGLWCACAARSGGISYPPAPVEVEAQVQSPKVYFAGGATESVFVRRSHTELVAVLPQAWLGRRLTITLEYLQPSGRAHHQQLFDGIGVEEIRLPTDIFQHLDGFRNKDQGMAKIDVLMSSQGKEEQRLPLFTMVRPYPQASATYLSKRYRLGARNDEVLNTLSKRIGHCQRALVTIPGSSQERSGLAPGVRGLLGGTPGRHYDCVVALAYHDRGGINLNFRFSQITIDDSIEYIPSTQIGTHAAKVLLNTLQEQKLEFDLFGMSKGAAIVLHTLYGDDSNYSLSLDGQDSKIYLIGLPRRYASEYLDKRYRPGSIYVEHYNREWTLIALTWKDDPVRHVYKGQIADGLRLAFQGRHHVYANLMSARDPSQRYSMTELLAFRHAYLTGIEQPVGDGFQF